MIHVFDRFLRFFFPCDCLHCKNRLEKPLSMLCAHCMRHLSVNNELKNSCFEKMSPAFDLYKHYIDFHHKNLKKWFASSVALKFLNMEKPQMDYITTYYSFDKRLFSHSLSSFKAVIKEVSSILSIPYLSLFKFKLAEGVYTLQGLDEICCLRQKIKEPLEDRKLIIFSEEELSDAVKKRIKKLLTSTDVIFISFFS